MPIRFLKASGKGFFVEKDGYALALRDEIGDVVGNMAFGEQMGDVLGIGVWSIIGGGMRRSEIEEG